jgi:outer membrane protein
VVALALTQSGGIASAAPSSTVGVVDMSRLVMEHPDSKGIDDQMKAERDAAQKDYEEKAAGMSDQEKESFYRQKLEYLSNKENELLEQLLKKIEESVKQVADAKGLSVVVAKQAVIYGGTDITQDVISKFKK